MTSIGNNSGVDELGGMDQEQRPQGESMDRADTIENVEGGESTDAIELEEATLDPEALIEAQGDYAEAEAVEAALTELVDAAAANAPPTEEITVEAVDFDGDPLGEMKESGEKGGTADVVGEVAGQIREGEYDGKTKGNVEDIHAHESGEPVPTEEIGGVGSLEGVINQVSEGFDDEGSSQGNVETEIAQGYDELDRGGSSQGNVEVQPHEKGDPVPVEELGIDYKPIPADEGTVDLDGKGGDIRVDPEVKFDTAEGMLKGELDPEVKLDSAVGMVKGELDPESGSFVDFKFFKVEGQAGEEGSRIAKDPAYMEGIEQSQALEAALGRAVIDPAFRQELLDDASSALAEYDISAEAMELLSQIDPEGLEQVANQIKAQFENLEDPAAQTVLGRIISDVLSGGAGVVKDE